MNFGAYKLKDHLHPMFFRDDKMIPDVRIKLLKVANVFWRELEINEKYEDVILTGSIAGYNWNKFSDVDLHIVAAYDEINDDVEIVNNYLYTRSRLWNDKHDITFFKHNLEINCQNSEVNELVSNAVYSVLYDEWIIHPDLPEGVEINFARVSKYLSKIRDKFGKLLYKFNSKNYNGLYGEVDELKDKIYDMRKYGLNSSGEYSPENIAFKILRNDGILDDVKDIRDKVMSKDMSVDKEDILQPDKNKKEPEEEDNSKGEGRYLIGGRRFISLRTAAAILGIPKSTIEYRLKSDNPKWSNYRIINI